MNDLKIGQVIEITNPQRDAIHIAVAPVVASHRLSPGQHVGFIGETVGTVNNPIGIVDPFLEGQVFKGDRFWMFLYPGSITSLRHDWTHAAFSDQPRALSASEAWMRVFAGAAELSYDELLAGAKRYLDHGEYLCDGGKWEGFDMPEEFWDHYEVVTGTTVAPEDRGHFFSCSC